MWIMIAGPYSAGGADDAMRRERLAEMNRIAYEVFRLGHSPVIGVNMALPVIEAAGEDRFEEIMMPLSLALAERCDAVLRIGGASAGADAEVELVSSRGGVVYRSLSDIPAPG